MFKNCIDYNRGNAGQWFRGEANRQNKVFKDEILPQAKRFYQKEVTKHTAAAEQAEVTRKRKAEDEELAAASTIKPMPAIFKKRKKKVANAAHEYLPSMPALAAMLLLDPFVVRVFLAQVLWDLKRGVMAGSLVPAAHSVVPSLMQILYLVQWSSPLCAVRRRDKQI